MYLIGMDCIWLYWSRTKLTEFDEENDDHRQGMDTNGNVLCLCCRMQAAAFPEMDERARDGSAVAEVSLLVRANGSSWMTWPGPGRRGGDVPLYYGCRDTSEDM